MADPGGPRLPVATPADRYQPDQPGRPAAADPQWRLLHRVHGVRQSEKTAGGAVVCALPLRQRRRPARAHLKLAEQRKYTQKDLLKQHVQASLRSPEEPGAEPIRRIVYVLITPPVDQLFLAIAPAPRASQ